MRKIIIACLVIPLFLTSNCFSSRRKQVREVFGNPETVYSEWIKQMQLTDDLMFENSETVKPLVIYDEKIQIQSQAFNSNCGRLFLANFKAAPITINLNANYDSYITLNVKLRKDKMRYIIDYCELKPEKNCDSKYILYQYIVDGVNKDWESVDIEVGRQSSLNIFLLGKDVNCSYKYHNLETNECIPIVFSETDKIKKLNNSKLIVNWLPNKRIDD